MLLDVNVLVALAWDSHVHHAAARRWFLSAPRWATCSVTEMGFVRVSANRRVLPAALPVAEARAVLAAFRERPGHVFLADDVSPTDADFPVVHGHRQVTDAHLLTVARRHGTSLTTFDRALAALGGADVHLLDA